MTEKLISGLFTISSIIVGRHNKNPWKISLKDFRENNYDCLT
jgi:hypothetical protein